MVDLDSIYASMSVQRGGAPTVWETCELLLDQCDAGHDVIAATQPGSYLESMLRKTLSPERLFVYATRSSLGAGPFSRTVSACRREGPDIVLGACDHDLVPARRPWPYVALDPVVRMRTLDGLHGRSHKPGLIVIESDILDILTGAMAAIQQHRPAILLNLTAVSPTQRLMEWERCVTLLASSDYGWCDGFLLPCDTTERRRDLAGPLCTGLACALPAVTPTKPGASGGLALAERDWVSDIRFDRNRLGKMQIVFDRSVVANGLYSPEPNGAGSWWRWSGPLSRIRLSLPLPAGGTWFLRLEVFDWGIARRDHDVRAFANEKELIYIDSGPHFIRFGPILVPLREASGYLLVEINTPRPVRASNDDPRLIGVGFSSCVLERAI
jgi:hypothetical protein